MSLSLQLAPPTEPGEIETLTFDFGPTLGAGESIVSVVSVLVAVLNGTDKGTNHFQGTSAVVPSPSSGASAGAVVQQVQNMLAGCLYQYQCLVETSAGQTLQLRVNLPCAVVPTGST